MQVLFHRKGVNLHFSAVLHRAIEASTTSKQETNLTTIKENKTYTQKNKTPFTICVNKNVIKLDLIRTFSKNS